MGIHEDELSQGEHIETENTQEQSLGVTLPPPPGRHVHMPHNIYRGGGVEALEAPQDRFTRDGRAPKQDPFREAMAEQGAQEAMVEQGAQGAMAEHAVQEAMHSSEQGWTGIKGVG